MLLAEEFLLLLLDDVTGKPTVDPSRLDLALAGAVVLELAELGRVAITEPGERVRTGRLVVRDGSPTGDAVLDGALERINDKKPGKPQAVLQRLSRRLRPTLLTRLVDRGLLRREEHTTLGLFRSRRWPASESSHERSVRSALYDVLVTGRAPQPREVAVISLLRAIDQVPKVLPDTGLSKRELNRRAKHLSEGEFAGAAVRKAVEAVNASMLAAISAGAVATGSAGT